jgi:ABC-type uncharacterized transport system fused permease/ATPase subunit
MIIVLNLSWLHPHQLRKGIRDDDLLTYLDLVKLTYIQERDGRWDAVADWMDVLSGGEKQRIAVRTSK